MNVTFFSDGQQGVVKTPGVVEVLLELSTAQNKQLREKAILVLRNLCFHGASKPVLLVNGELRKLPYRTFKGPRVLNIVFAGLQEDA